MKRIVLVSLALLALAAAAFGQQTVTQAAVGAASTVASADMGPGIESLKANAQEDYAVVSGDTLKAVSEAAYGDYRYWPIVYLTNKEAISNPERIEPGLAIKIYKLPFDAKAPNELSKRLIAETYVQAYERYVALGASWTDARRWVLLEALRFAPNLFADYASRIDDGDEAWYRSR